MNTAYGANLHAACRNAQLAAFAVRTVANGSCPVLLQAQATTTKGNIYGDTEQWRVIHARAERKQVSGSTEKSEDGRNLQHT
jgi:hypothetical protein